MERLIEQVNSVSELSSDAKQHIIEWLSGDKFSEYHKEIETLVAAKEWKVLEDNFFRVLPFGTGGRRGTFGVGSNRVNKVTIGEAAQALSDYAEELHGSELDKGVVIAYDSRNTSVELSRYVATVFAANGLRTYLFDDVRSTPELSFMVRQLGTLAGVVISASHNPSSDNGIKIYWGDGGQVVAPHDYELLLRCESTNRILQTDYDKAVASGKIVLIGDKEDEAYFAAVLGQSQSADFRSAKIAYSPLHGAGMSSVLPTLRRAGFEVSLLEEQSNYDGNFTNVTNNIPNPELLIANDKVSQLALSDDCDIAITNDPDADRLAVLVVENGQVVQLTGNQMAVLLCDYLLGSQHDQGKISPKDFIAKTIVTTDMLYDVARDYGVNVRGNLLVGFKYIGELIHIYCDKSDEKFLFGGEESYGALVGSYCRDKDAAGASLLAAELASKMKNENKTLITRLNELYEKHGYYKEQLESITYTGASGFHAMKTCMDSLRKDPPTMIGNQQVIKTRDYLLGEEIEGKVEDVLRFEFSEDGRDRVTIRPSGTEPKIKVYTQIHHDFDGDLGQVKSSGDTKAKALAEATIELVKKFAH